MTKPYEVPFRVNVNDCNLNENDSKRISKPQLEKKRRARINLSLNQLKEMIIDSGKQNVQNKKAKLEKADILELTVKYVQQIERNEVSNHKENTGANQKQINNEFVSGFSECIKRVEEFVSNNSPTDPIVVTFLRTQLNQFICSMQTHNNINSGVIRHTGQCCPPSPAPSTASSASGGNPLIDTELSSIGINDERIPLNLTSSNRSSELTYHERNASEDPVWRPW